MFQSHDSGTPVSTGSADNSPRYETIRHILIGPKAALDLTVKVLHTLGYVEATAWSQPQPTGDRTHERITVLIRRLRIE